MHTRMHGESMAPMRVSFLVDSVEPSEFVCGKNGEVDISVGTVFTSIRRTRVDGDLQHLHTVDLGIVAKVELALETVEWYGRTIDVVPGGHSAALKLKGTGLDELTALLEQAGPREYLHLEANISTSTPETVAH